MKSLKGMIIYLRDTGIIILPAKITDGIWSESSRTFKPTPEMIVSIFLSGELYYGLILDKLNRPISLSEIDLINNRDK